MNLNFKKFVNDILKDHLNCWTPNCSKATSFCIQCKVFLCEKENCWNSHIFHQLENLESLSKKKFTPLIQKLIDNEDLKNLKKMKKKIKNFKKNFDTFIQKEKNKALKFIEEISNVLNEVYRNYAIEIQKTQIMVKLKLAELDTSNENQSINSCELLKNIVNMTLAQNTKKKDFFMIQIISNFDELNNFKFLQKKIKIDDSLTIIKELYQKDFDAISEGKLISDIRTKSLDMISYFNKNIKQKNLDNNDKLQIYNDSKNNSQDDSINNLIKSNISGKENNIDLDIFFRKMVSEFNLIRNTSNYLINYKQEFNESINKEIDNLIVYQKKLPKLKEFEWDSDLAEAAEKYLIIYPKDFKQNFGDLNSKMIEIIENIYPFQNIETHAIIGAPFIKTIISKMILNWKYFSKIFFGHYNLIGISALQIQDDKVIFIINMAEFTK